MEGRLQELQEANAKAEDEALRQGRAQKTARERQSRAEAKKAAEYAARQPVEQKEIEELMRKRDLLRVETAAEEERQEQLRAMSTSSEAPLGIIEPIRGEGRKRDPRKTRHNCSNVSSRASVEGTAHADSSEGKTTRTSRDVSNSAWKALRELEMTRTVSGNNVVLFNMACALASIPLDGGASAVMHGVALLLQAVSWVKGNLELVHCVPLAIQGLRLRVAGLEMCLTQLQSAPNTSSFLADSIKATGNVLAESCRIIDDVIATFKDIDRGGRVERKVRAVYGKRQKRCAEKIAHLADQIQSVRGDLHFCISVDTNISSRTASQEDTSQENSRILSSIQTSARSSTLQGMQAIAAASGAFGDVQMLLVTLKTLVHQVLPTAAGVRDILEKLEDLSLSDIFPNLSAGGRTGGSAVERAGVGGDEVLALREELRGPVESLISAVACAGDEVLSKEERSLALEMIGCMWRPWRSVGRKDLSVGQNIGSGTSGSVYAADWTPGGSGSSPICVAVKCIDVSGDESQRRQKVEDIEIEAGVMRDCKHACVVSMYGVVLPPVPKSGLEAVQGENSTYRNAGMSFIGPSPGCTCSSSRRILSIAGKADATDSALILMEQMGGNVMRTMQMGALPSIDDRILVLRDAADGMAFLHSRGVAHLDLKPENILLDVELQTVGGEENYQLFGRAKVCDFGASCRAAADTVQWALTRGVGTLEYMATEMLKEARPTATAACDVFSFGVVICAMLGSEKSLKKYQERSVQERVDMSRAGRLSKLLAQCIGSIDDDRMREVCQTCVEDLPGERPRFKRFLEAMNAILQNSGKTKFGVYV